MASLSDHRNGAGTDKSEPMDDVPVETQILRHLAPVFRRQRRKNAFRGMATGLLVGGLMCFSVAAIQLTGSHVWLKSIDVLIVISGAAVIGAFCGWLLRMRLRDAARIVDQHFGWKDSTQTALEFARRSEVKPIHRLQLNDLLNRLAAGSPGESIDITVPAHLPRGLAISLVAVVVSLFQPVSVRPVAEDRMLYKVQATSELIRQDLSLLERSLPELPQFNKRRLMSELEQRRAALQQKQTNQLQAMRHLTSMQQLLERDAVQERVSQMNRFLQALGDVLTGDVNLQALGTEIQSGELQEAANTLDELRETNESATNQSAQNQAIVSDSESARKLADLARAMKEAGHSELSEAVSSLSDPRDSSVSLAEILRQHDEFVGASELLQEYAERLDGYKSELRRTGSGKNRSEQQSIGANEDLRSAQRRSDLDSSLSSEAENAESEDAFSNEGDSAGGEAGGGKAGSGRGGTAAGTSSEGSEFGEISSIKSKRQLAELRGRLSPDGRRRMEKVPSQENSGIGENAMRELRKINSDYDFRSRAVLKPEEIPFGYRDSVRDYFERLREISSRRE